MQPSLHADPDEVDRDETLDRAGSSSAPGRRSDGVRTFIFAGGGTGGHIYPALAISEALAQLSPEARVHCICSDKPLDAAILERAVVACTPIPARRFSLTPGGATRLALSWGKCVRACQRAIEMARADSPGGVVVVAMGGYVAAPAARAAKAAGVSLAIVNLDAAPGLANRWIAKRAALRCIVNETTLAGGGEELRIRPIVRQGAIASEPREQCAVRLGLDAGLATLLVTGGSQGASSINGLLEALARRRSGAFAGWQALHQSGDAKWSERLNKAYAGAGVPAVVVETIEDMGSAWGAAEAAVGRAGAGTVAEVWANAVPTIFLPYPHHKDEHQRRNAAPLVEAGGAVVERDLIDPMRNLEGPGAAIAALLRHARRREAMRQGLRRLPPADGAARVAEALARLP